MFFTIEQNNRGYLILDRRYGIGQYVIIEADNAGRAIDILYEIGENIENFHRGCSCCGERWPSLSEGSIEAYEEPRIYGEKVEEYAPPFFLVDASRTCFVHYADSTVKHIIFGSCAVNREKPCKPK